MVCFGRNLPRKIWWVFQTATYIRVYCFVIMFCNKNLFLNNQVQPKHVKEAFRLLNKSIIRVDSPDINFDQEEDEDMNGNPICHNHIIIWIRILYLWWTQTYLWSCPCRSERGVGWGDGWPEWWCSGGHGHWRGRSAREDGYSQTSCPHVLRRVPPNLQPAGATHAENGAMWVDLKSFSYVKANQYIRNRSIVTFITASFLHFSGWRVLSKEERACQLVLEGNWEWDRVWGWTHCQEESYWESIASVGPLCECRLDHRITSHLAEVETLLVCHCVTIFPSSPREQFRTTYEISDVSDFLNFMHDSTDQVIWLKQIPYTSHMPRVVFWPLLSNSPPRI